MSRSSFKSKSTRSSQQTQKVQTCPILSNEETIAHELTSCRKLCLRFNDGSRRNFVRDLNHETIVGSASDCTIQLTTDELVKPRHFQIKYMAEEGFMLTAIKNAPTYLKLSASISRDKFPLEVGDIFVIGEGTEIQILKIEPVGRVSEERVLSCSSMDAIGEDQSKTLSAIFGNGFGNGITGALSEDAKQNSDNDSNSNNISKNRFSTPERKDRSHISFSTDIHMDDGTEGFIHDEKPCTNEPPKSFEVTMKFLDSGNEITIKADSILIGSDPNVDVTVFSAGVSATHAQLLSIGHHLYIRDFSIGNPYGTRIKVTRSVKVLANDAISLGEAESTIVKVVSVTTIGRQESWETAAVRIQPIRRSKRCGRHIIGCHDMPIKTHMLYDVSTFGRSKIACNLVANDYTIAAVQGAFFFAEGRLSVESLANNRKMGVYLLIGRKGNQNHNDVHCLSVGDEIRVGGTTFKVMLMKTETRVQLKQRRKIYNERVKILQSTDRFSVLGDDDMMRIASAASEVTFEDGEYAYQQDTPAQAFFILYKGTIAIQRECRSLENDTASNEIIAELEPGDYFGEVSMLSDANSIRNVSAVAKGTVQCLRFEKQAFLSLVVPLVGPILSPEARKRERQIRMCLLKSVSFLRHVPLGALDILCDRLKMLVFEPGEYLCRQNEVGDRVLFLVTGSVQVKKGIEGVTESPAVLPQASTNNNGLLDNDSSQFLDVRQCSAGHYFGEMAILVRQASNSDVIATTPIQCLCLERGPLEEVLKPVIDKIRQTLLGSPILTAEDKSNTSTIPPMSLHPTGPSLLPTNNGKESEEEDDEQEDDQNQQQEEQEESQQLSLYPTSRSPRKSVPVLGSQIIFDGTDSSSSAVSEMGLDAGIIEPLSSSRSDDALMELRKAQNSARKQEGIHDINNNAQYQILQSKRHFDDQASSKSDSSPSHSSNGSPYRSPKELTRGMDNLNTPEFSKLTRKSLLRSLSDNNGLSNEKSTSPRLPSLDFKASNNNSFTELPQTTFLKSNGNRNAPLSLRPTNSLTSTKSGPSGLPPRRRKPRAYTTGAPLLSMLSDAEVVKTVEDLSKIHSPLIQPRLAQFLNKQNATPSLFENDPDGNPPEEEEMPVMGRARAKSGFFNREFGSVRKRKRRAYTQQFQDPVSFIPSPQLQKTLTKSFEKAISMRKRDALMDLFVPRKSLKASRIRAQSLQVHSSDVVAEDILPEESDDGSSIGEEDDTETEGTNYLEEDELGDSYRPSDSPVRKKVPVPTRAPISIKQPLFKLSPRSLKEQEEKQRIQKEEIQVKLSQSPEFTTTINVNTDEHSNNSGNTENTMLAMMTEENINNAVAIRPMNSGNSPKARKAHSPIGAAGVSANFSPSNSLRMDVGVPGMAAAAAAKNKNKMSHLASPSDLASQAPEIGTHTYQDDPRSTAPVNSQQNFQTATNCLLLKAVSGPIRKQKFMICSHSVVIGNQRGGVRIADEDVSPEHCLIEYRNGRYWLSDLGSTTGTFLKLRAQHEYILEAGDVLQFGNSECQVYVRHRFEKNSKNSKGRSKNKSKRNGDSGHSPLASALPSRSHCCTLL
eukprot:TRINITY_DN4524_c3_g3_i1.p1 TRINITY_DN4524_c3_g3~~TRINITY_DN4524_c3_g3_i1.p1  ORF type:complete len:1568 (-),score=463.11 TRINITY_DN4524_c3_g3_i1:451-5154(-)